MKSNIDEMSARMRATYEDDMWLGHLVWYEVTKEARITLADWMHAVYGTGVSDLVPKAPRAVDVFKRAVAATQDRRKVRAAGALGGNYTYKFLPRSAGQDAEMVYRALVVEELDESGNKLQHHQVVTFPYDRRTEKILEPKVETELLAAYPQEVQQIVVDKVEAVFDFFTNEANVLSAIKIRELIRHEIQERQRGVPAKDAGGIYFVFNNHLDRLDALAQLVKQFPGCMIHTLPVVDDTNQREMVRGAFENEADAEASQLMTDMMELMSGKRGGITAKKAREIHSRYLEMNKRLAEYSDTLEMSLDKTGARLKIIQKQVTEVFRKVDPNSTGNN